MGNAFLSLVCAVMIHQQGSDSFRQREAATTALRQLIPYSIPYLNQGIRHRDAEIAARCAGLVDAWWEGEAWRLTDACVPEGWDAHPWLDMLPADYKDRDHVLPHFVAWAHHNAREWKSSKGYPEYRAATRQYFYLLIRNRVKTPAQVRHLAEEMGRIEVRWKGVWENQQP